MSKPPKPDKKPATKADVAKPTKSRSELPDTSRPTKPLPDATTRPPRTVTVPEHLRGPWTQGPESVTALAVEGHDRVYELPRMQAEITLGSENDQDVVIASQYVSRKHCVIQRRGLRTYIVDKGSKNGIVVDGVVEKEFEAPPGKRFKLGGQLAVVALNDAMKQQLPVVGQVVCRESENREKGGKDRPTPLDVLALALDVAPILITGEAGCDHDRLARALHAMSPRRAHDLITLTSVPEDRKTQRAAIDAAARSTLILPLSDTAGPLDPAFVSTLFDRSYNIRVIALASTVAIATEVLGEDAVGRTNKIHLRSIAFRPGVIAWLIDETLRERGSTLRTAELTTENRDALVGYDWKRNFVELREVADWLIAIEKYGSVRAAAEQLGVARETFSRWIRAHGINAPLRHHRR